MYRMCISASHRSWLLIPASSVLRDSLYFGSGSVNCDSRDVRDDTYLKREGRISFAHCGKIISLNRREFAHTGILQTLIGIDPSRGAPFLEARLPLASLDSRVNSPVFPSETLRDPCSVSFQVDVIVIQAGTIYRLARARARARAEAGNPLVRAERETARGVRAFAFISRAGDIIHGVYLCARSRRSALSGYRRASSPRGGIPLSAGGRTVYSFVDVW